GRRSEEGPRRVRSFQMRKDLTMKLTPIILLSAYAACAYGQSKNIEFELMTWPELKHAIHDDGKTTAIVFNGGTEQRGPQGVAGAHTLVGRLLAKEIAEKLSNAIVAPVLPYSLNSASAALPGTIGLTG